MERLLTAVTLTTFVTTQSKNSFARAAADNNKNKNCSLNCHGNGTCKFGPKISDNNNNNANTALPWLQTTQEENGMHCICNKGYTGLKCNIEEVICGEEEGEWEEIKSHRCHHGSTCVNSNNNDKEEEENGGGEKEYHCDCTRAFAKGRRTAGTYCEYVETDACDDELFCVNDGTCVNLGDDDINPQYKCFCPPNFEGPRCEYLKNEAPSCTLQCQNNGQCIIGTKQQQDSTFLNGWDGTAKQQQQHQNFQHCACPKGFVGLQCEIPVVECITDYGALCFNGGQCVEDEENDTYFCDCTKAAGGSNSGGGGVSSSFAGPLCLQESTEFCDVLEEGRDAAQEFCTNGGTCPQEGQQGCVCNDDWEGPRCEFKKGTAPDCTLRCQNNGECRFGAKTMEWASLTNPNNNNNNNDNSIHDNGMHCACPTGFTGVNCETEYETCHSKNDENPHICQHGGSCISNGKDFLGNDIYGCDCSTASISVAGAFCEHVADEYCVKDQEDGGVTHSFCTNGGKCKRVIDGDEEHAGCSCPDNFDGPHCEIPVVVIAPQTQSASPKETPRAKAKKITGVVLITFSFAAIIAIYAYTHIKKRLRNEKEAREVHIAPMSPKKEMTEDGEMVDVEII